MCFPIIINRNIIRVLFFGIVLLSVSDKKWCFRAGINHQTGGINYGWFRALLYSLYSSLFFINHFFGQLDRLKHYTKMSFWPLGHRAVKTVKRNNGPVPGSGYSELVNPGGGRTVKTEPTR